MIIDIHGHYTTAPKALEEWRNRQIAGIKDPSAMPKVSELKISDDELRETIETPVLSEYLTQQMCIGSSRSIVDYVKRIHQGSYSGINSCFIGR